MEDIFEIGMLLDFYGQMLTSRQYEILDLHYNNDYSLGEIAEQLNISRQGVYDNIRRGKLSLYEFEDKLGLVKRFANQKKKAEEVLEYLKRIDRDTLNVDDRENLNKIEEGITDIINWI